MRAIDYLADLPAVVINLDSRPDRWANIQANVAPYVKSVVRSPGFPKKDLLDQQVDRFREDMQYADERLRRKGIDIRFQVLSVSRAIRGAAACRLAHLDAIRAGAMLYDRFLVLEDDACVRPWLAEDTPAPAPGSINLWGGVRVGGLEKHRIAALMAPSMTNSWWPITREDLAKARFAVAVAMEFSSDTVDDYIAAHLEFPGVYDAAWQVAMHRMPFMRVPHEIIMHDKRLPSSLGSRPLSDKMTAEFERTLRRPS